MWFVFFSLSRTQDEVLQVSDKHIVIQTSNLGMWYIEPEEMNYGHRFYLPADVSLTAMTVAGGMCHFCYLPLNLPLLCKPIDM